MFSLKLCNDLSNPSLIYLSHLNEKFSVPEGRENDLLTFLGYIPVLCLFHLPFLSTLSSCYFLLLSRRLE